MAKKYATVSWWLSDIISVARDKGQEMTEAEAEEWLSNNAKYISEAMTTAGYEAIDALWDA